VWARNLGDETYYTSANKVIDTLTAYTGKPRTVGASISFRFK
jgi:outer membrane receptor protein involved in Fe transport